MTYFDNLSVDCISKEIKKFMGNKLSTTNIYRIQAYDSIMCEYFYIEFIDFVFKVKVC